MSKNFIKEDIELARKYFLGQTADAERDSIENRFFIDEEYSYFLDKTERDLIDEFVRKNLSDADARHFEKHYLVSDERRAKLRFARALSEKLTARNTESQEAVTLSSGSKWFDFLRMPRLVFAGGLGILLLLFGIFGIWLSQNRTIDQVQNNTNTEVDLPDPIKTAPQVNKSNSTLPTNSPGENTNSNQESSNSNKNPAARKPGVVVQPSNTPENTNAAKPVENKTINPLQPSFASLLLLPTTRGTDKPTVEINDRGKGLKLTIVSDNAQEFDLFKVEVSSASGTILARQIIRNASQKSSKTFSVNIPADKISDGQFEVNLSGIDKNNPPKSLNFYEFNINKK